MRELESEQFLGKGRAVSFLSDHQLKVAASSAWLVIIKIHHSKMINKLILIDITPSTLSTTHLHRLHFNFFIYMSAQTILPEDDTC